jgi:hypothetical protein
LQGQLVNPEARRHRPPLPHHRDPGRPTHHHRRRPTPDDPRDALDRIHSAPVRTNLSQVRNLTKHNITELTTLVKTRLRRMQYRPGVLDGFLAKTGLDLTLM